MTSEVTQTEVQEALLAIFTERGYLDAASVVEEAVDPLSPLHPHLTWDDTEAARKRRLDEARKLIRSVKINIVDHSGGQRTLNYFVHSKPAAQAVIANDQEAVNQEALLRASYVPAQLIGQNEMLTKITLRQMETDFRRLERRWGGYQEFYQMIWEQTQGRAQ
jgi:hypothetical protein